MEYGQIGDYDEEFRDSGGDSNDVVGTIEVLSFQPQQAGVLIVKEVGHIGQRCECTPMDVVKVSSAGCRIDYRNILLTGAA